MKFKPMLAEPIADTSTLKYPLFASIKYDGIRAMMQDGKLVSRKLKLIPNVQVQAKFAGLPEGIDGELVAANPADKNAMQATSSGVMSRNKDASDVVFYAFDMWHPTEGFEARKRMLNALAVDMPDVFIVPQHLIENEAQLLQFEEKTLEQGYEGVMVRSIDGPYKQGRATVKQGWLLKLKRFEDAEAEVIGTYEMMENQNEAKKGADGHTERSTKKEGMVLKGTLGGFDVRGINGIFKDVEFGVASGLNDELRATYWKQRNKLVGKILKYKYFPIGVKDKPRLPIFLGFRDKRDM